MIDGPFRASHRVARSLGRHPLLLGCTLGLLLLACNGAFSTLASPFVLTQRFDGVQYQLLARNRLHGHYEVGDEAHAVHEEGCHPMWRPGLVWVEEGLARCLGSVRKGAAAASALGTTLLELALLCLAWRAYGEKTALSAFLTLRVPEVALPLLGLAVGQGPEVWAAAAFVTGLAALFEALRRHSLGWALAAGSVAGAAEWFRTGNILLFAIPCAVYGGVYLRQRDWRGCCLPGGAFLAWVGMAALAGLAVPSTVNKTIANLWACRPALAGPWITHELADGSHFTCSLLGYTLVPGTTETYLDHSLRSSRGRSTLAFCREHARELTAAYVQRFQQVLTSGFWGLRQMVGESVLILFVLQLLFCLLGGQERHTLAFAGAALGHYLGPVVLIVGDEATHYVLVAFPLFVLVAAQGAVRLSGLVLAWYARTGSGASISADTRARGLAPACNASFARWLLLGLAVFLIAIWSLPFYTRAATQLRHLHQQALQEQAALDALGLHRLRVACRNMSWFVDRDVCTVFLPYATVAELKDYIPAHRIDGILIWEHEATPPFRATPYGSLPQFARALQESRLFGPGQVSGSWQWYPVRHSKE